MSRHATPVPASGWLRRARSLRDDSGSLTVALLFIMVGTSLLIIIAAVATRSVASTQSGVGTVVSGQAADAGVQASVYGLNHGVNPSATPVAGDLTGGGSWSFTGSESGGVWTVRSVGKVHSQAVVEHAYVAEDDDGVWYVLAVWN